MVKRLSWLMIGAGLGLGSSFWITRRVKQTIARYSPERVTGDLTAAARGLAADVRAAVDEGREAMRKREAELRADLRLN